MPTRTVVATRTEVRAAKLRLKVDAKLGRASDPAVVAIANARPVPARQLTSPAAS